MTPFEWCLAGLLIGPVLSAAAIWFLHPTQGYRTGTVLLALAGMGGVIAALMGAVAETPYTLPTNTFYNMVAAIDKFSAIFLLPLAVTVLFAGKMAWLRVRKTAEYDALLHLSLVALVIGATWTLISGNILGFSAALWVFATGKAIAVARSNRNQEGRALIWMVAPVFLSGLACAAGLFVASGGALFSDFSTLAYIASELGPTQIGLSFGLIVAGVAALSNAFSCKAAREQLALLPSAHRAVISVAEAIVPLYIFSRLLLFVFPPLSVWHALVVGLVAVAGLLLSTRKGSEGNYAGMLGLLMLAGAMIFQTLALYEVMNIALFAALIVVVGSAPVAIGAALTVEALPDSDKKTSLIQSLLVVSTHGLVPSTLAVALWMFSTALLSEAQSIEVHAAGWPIAVAFVLVLGVLAFTTWRVISQSVYRIRAIVTATHHESASVYEKVLVIAVAALSVIAPFFIPNALIAIGANPLTDGIGTWNAAVVSGDSMLRLFIIGLVCVSARIFVHISRVEETNAVLVLPAETGDEVNTPHPLLVRATAFGRSLRRVAKQYAVMPTHTGITRVRTWYDHHAHASAYLALAVMVLTVTLTLIIAL